jgi:hypothetical protein
MAGEDWSAASWQGRVNRAIAGHLIQQFRVYDKVDDVASVTSKSRPLLPVHSRTEASQRGSSRGGRALIISPYIEGFLVDDARGHGLTYIRSVSVMT